MNILDEVIQDKNTVIFLGAGASYGSGLPLGDEAAITIIKNIYKTLDYSDKWNSLQTLTEENTVFWPRFEVVCSSLAKYFPDMINGVLASFNDIGMSTTHQILTMVFRESHLWLTTNFDNILERSMDELDLSYKVISNKTDIQDALASPLKEHIIIKLHGDTNSINTKESQNLGIEIEHILREMPISASNPISNFCNNKYLLFIGYAARDPDLSSMLLDIGKVARGIAWIGYGESPKPVNTILELTTSAYYDKGAFEELKEYVDQSNLTYKREDDVWEERIRDWLLLKSRNELKLSLVDILCEKDDKDSLLQALSFLDKNSNNWLEKVRFLEVLAKYTLEYDPSSHSLTDVEAFFDKVLENKHDLPEEIIIKTLSAYSLLLWRKGELDRALLLSQESYKYCQEKSYSWIKTQVQCGNILTYIGSSRSSEAFETLKSAVTEAKKQNEIRLEAEAGLRLAIAYMRLDKPDLAEKVLLNNEMIFTEIGDPRNIAVWKLNYAESLRIQGKFLEAINANVSSLELARMIDNKEIQWKTGCNLGLCYLCELDFERAEENFLKSLEISSRSNDPECTGNCLYDLGWLRTLLFFWNDAKAFFRKASKVYSSCNNLERTGAALTYLGICHLFTGNINDAIESYNLINEKKCIPHGLYYPLYIILSLGIDFPGQDVLSLLNQSNLLSDYDQEYIIYYLILLLYLFRDEDSKEKEIIIEQIKSEVKTCEYDIFQFFAWRSMCLLGFSPESFSFSRELPTDENIQNIQKNSFSNISFINEI